MRTTESYGRGRTPLFGFVKRLPCEAIAYAYTLYNRLQWWRFENGTSGKGVLSALFGGIYTHVGRRLGRIWRLFIYIDRQVVLFENCYM